MSTTQLSPRVQALLTKTHATRARLVFAIDATASRESTWDLASQLQVDMFTEAAAIGGLQIQLAYYRGGEFQAFPWVCDAAELVSRMRMIRCEAGPTQIERVLQHIREENQREKVAATVLISDACEEQPLKLYAAANNLNVPLFVFQEGDNLVVHLDRHGRFVSEHEGLTVEHVFRDLARLTGGAYGAFDAGAAQHLGELLRAVAVFAAGGIMALANQNTASARKLLTQLR